VESAAIRIVDTLLRTLLCEQNCAPDAHTEEKKEVNETCDQMDNNGLPEASEASKSDLKGPN
jgi:hypothetical protein